MHAMSDRRPFDRSALDNAKRIVTISAAWRALGIPGEPSRVCRSPFREDRHASFSIYAEELLWKDFSTSEGGDVVAFVQRATGCVMGEAIRRVIGLAGGHNTPPTFAPRLPAPARPALPPRYDGLKDLTLDPPSLAEINILQELRAWPFNAGLEIANRRGLLRIADISRNGQVIKTWILTDNSRKSAQARRLDGKEWQFANGNTAKSNSLRTDPDAPPGLDDIVTNNRPAVLICEGEPDALSALTFAWLADIAESVGVICLTGASKGLPPAVCAALVGRQVRILRQADKPDKNGVKQSHRAALAWLESLHAAGIACDIANIDGLNRADGTPAKDIADLLRRPADLEDLEPIARQLLANLIS
jgi:hypothetical protein